MFVGIMVCIRSSIILGFGTVSVTITAANSYQYTLAAKANNLCASFALLGSVDIHSGYRSSPA